MVQYRQCSNSTSLIADETMETRIFPTACPNDVLIVEDDPIIALGFEDMILGFGVKTVRTAGSVARALDMIADRAPQFCAARCRAGP